MQILINMLHNGMLHVRMTVAISHGKKGRFFRNELLCQSLPFLSTGYRSLHLPACTELSSIVYSCVTYRLVKCRFV
jgi:hypothetical protein